MNSAPNDPQTYYPTSGGVERWSPAEQADPFVPTAVQLQRAQALKRFNRLTVYLPLGLITAAVVGFFVYLLIIAIWPPQTDTRLFLSGVADIIFILFMLPVALIFGLLLVAIFGGAIYWRQSRKEEGEPSLQTKYGRFRLLLWKLDQKLSSLYRQIDQLMPKLAAPVIKFNATITYINTRLARLSGRSDPNRQ
ncbi:MAG: hypothetical protein R3D55_03930 [Chloroflexota bacterium]